MVVIDIFRDKANDVAGNYPNFADITTLSDDQKESWSKTCVNGDGANPLTIVNLRSVIDGRTEFTVKLPHLIEQFKEVRVIYARFPPTLVEKPTVHGFTNDGNWYSWHVNAFHITCPNMCIDGRYFCNDENQPIKHNTLAVYPTGSSKGSDFHYSNTAFASEEPQSWNTILSYPPNLELKIKITDGHLPAGGIKFARPHPNDHAHAVQIGLEFR